MKKTTGSMCPSGHGQYRTEYHICWITKYRRPILTTAMRKYINTLLPKILGTMPGCEVVASNILEDHVHIVMVIPPKYVVKDVIGKLKGISSSKLKQKFGIGKAVWSPGNFVATVGVPEDKVIDYVRNQRLRHGREGY